MIAQQEGRDAGKSRLPDGLTRERHLEEAHSSPWRRRAIVVVLVAFCIAGLANVFGQVAVVDHAGNAKASLTVDSPVRVRAGVIFTTVITVAAHQPFQDARLQLSPGWLDGMTLNAFAPQSQQETADQHGGILDYGQLSAAQTLPVWISWQVNPTTVGVRSADVLLFDGTTLVTEVHRTVTVFP